MAKNESSGVNPQQDAGLRRREFERIRELEAQVADLQRRLQTTSSRLMVPAAELPVDYKGFLGRRVEVSLRPDLRRLLVALHQHLKAHHATIRHPRYHDQTRHVDDPAHTIVWLLERVQLTGAANHE